MNIIKQNGGDLNWFNAAINSDITLLKANLQCGKLKNIKIFASCRDINIVNIDGNTALMLAIINVFNKVFNNKAIKYNNTNIFNDRMYNLLCDSIIFLYNMNYYNFLHSIIYDNNSIYNIKNFKALINRIHNENGYLPHYLYIYKLLFSDNYKPLIKNYTYIYTPDNLLKEMNINPAKVLVYNMNIYYDKYIKDIKIFLNFKIHKLNMFIINTFNDCLL